MRTPKLSELPPPPSGKRGWPWTEESSQLPDAMPDGQPWPKISIVTPSFNQAQFLEETIRSVLLQGYPDVEYIIMDGGSTDGSVDIIKKYEPWLAYWVSAMDRGQSDAINRGWAQATGDIVAYINSDDSYCMGAFEAAANALCGSPEVGMVYGNLVLVDERGGILRKNKLHDMDFGEVIAWQDYIPQPTVFLRARTIREVGPTNESLHFSMDYDYWLRVGLKFQMKHILRELARATIHSQAKTTADALKGIIETFEVAEHFFAQQLPPSVAQYKDQTFASLNIRKGNYHFKMGHMAEARACVRQALSLKPPFFYRRKAVGLYLKTLFGARLSRWLKQTKQRVLSAIYRSQRHSP